MSDRPLRLGIIGAGGIAQSYAQVFHRTNVGRVVAVTDVRADAAASLAEALNATPFTSHTEMLAGAGLDAVIVCTPPVTHRDIVLDVINQGVHVLCEKPLSIAVSRAVQMVAAAERAGVVFTMAAKFRYVEDVIRAKSIVDSGILGEIILFENVFASRVPMGHRWNADPAVSGGGVLIDNGTHSVDIVRYFLGPIREVMSVECRRVQSLAVEDTAQMFVRTESDLMGNVDLSWSVDRTVDSYINVYGTHGTVSVGWNESSYRQVTSPDWVPFGSGYDKVACMRRQVENFCDAVRGRDKLLITPEDAIASVAVIEAAYRSLEQRTWVSVDTPRREDIEPVAASARVA